MIATICTIQVWLIMGIASICAIFCAFIGLLFLINWPK